ncbi:helix-turn-helix domain-containing protein [Nocardioides dubius]|uniref:PucR C-terminal helix-turn-helix domain-containing protein n=1 Tax=Nocardioides dubius TaxID=317019 RepID=A0ABN1TPE9_9ACTN
MSTGDWDDVVALVEAVMADEDLVTTAITGVRQLVQEVASLPPADMAGQTRAMMAAATRALAGRRGPTEAELSFVEDLAVTRAQQGIPIEVVLAAIHVSERAIWSRGREVAAELGLDPMRVLDARELYDDWAEAVRARLIRAHREAGSRSSGADREVEVVRRLLGGGTAGALAAAEAGLTPGRPVWVLAAQGDDALQRLRKVAGHRPQAWAADLIDGSVAITARAPADPGSGAERDAGADRDGGAAAEVIGVAGPVPIEEAGAARRLAITAIAAGRSAGRQGLVPIAEVAVLAALGSREDLAVVLEERYGTARAALGAQAPAVTRTVLAWLDAARETEVAAAALYVHANTVRNRVQRFSEVTGLDLGHPVEAMQAWWLCELWSLT